MKVYLSIGGNLGDREQNLELARRSIEEEIGKIILASSIYETAAWGITDQPDFLNQVLEVETALLPFEILDKIQQIEQKMGRVKIQRWGTRVIDVDILFYGNEIIQSQRLTIPHPGIPDRNFVLVPMREIAADLWHPVLEKTIESLSLACPDLLEVKIFKENY
ncbi:MAG: 2-amino-4-hydroxy-6-hydroxymethyldihydropteridine diphosphokinase [Bacteroidota bacterium]